MSTKYKNVTFRSRLEARWAAFFDLLRWKWSYEPIDFVGWIPDFEVTFPCGHSECPGVHMFYAEVKPYHSIGEFTHHPVMRNDYGQTYGLDGGLALGLDPTVASVQFVHGSGGGIEGGIEFFASRANPELHESEIMFLWAEAGHTTQWNRS